MAAQGSMEEAGAPLLFEPSRPPPPSRRLPPPRRASRLDIATPSPLGLDGSALPFTQAFNSFSSRRSRPAVLALDGADRWHARTQRRRWVAGGACMCVVGLLVGLAAVLVPCQLGLCSASVRSGCLGGRGCGAHGSCTAHGICSCGPGWSGEACALERRGGALEPCKNCLPGSCIRAPDGLSHRCRTCMKGFIGKECSNAFRVIGATHNDSNGIYRATNFTCRNKPVFQLAGLAHGPVLYQAAGTFWFIGPSEGAVANCRFDFSAGYISSNSGSCPHSPDGEWPDHFAAAAAAAAVVIVVVAGGLLTIFTLSLFLSLPLALLPCHLFVFGRERLQWKLD